MTQTDERGLQGLTPKEQQGAPTCLQSAAYAALLLALAVAAGCSGLMVSTEDAPASGPEPTYNAMVANRLKSAFKDHASYEAFEISDYRWVHSIIGWSWLTCARFQDHGHRRTYALFIKANQIIDGRYAVQADGCDTGSYSPFDLMTGAARPVSAGVLEPLY
ncbi:MAG TPA: hypothetical protein VJX48_02175 [Xanthobacteraceae bacterium]|nr:hypothetical protein [Xanthobacteraceae bacterium]